MRTTLKILLPILLVGGCGRSTNESDANFVSLAEGFVVGCGPTRSAPTTFDLDGHETFGCTVFGRKERRKVESALRIHQVNVYLPNGTFEARPARPELDETKRWHAYFNLAQGRFADVKRVEVLAFYGNDVTMLKNDGLIVYDPEGLSERDEQENTFIVREPDDPVIDFKKVDGHILFVTEADLVPGRDFNSVKGADLRCSIEAQKLVQLAIYKFSALLADSETAFKDRMLIKGPIRDVEDKVILADGPSLFHSQGFDGKLKVINGDLASNALRVWTGTPEDNCDDWGSKDPAKSATIGNPSTELWQNAGKSSCSEGRRIYCISR